jgi:proton-translocating NAD(P)+ transhydrogenase subunit alpha
MVIAVPRENCPAECRVALVPSFVEPLIGSGHEVIIEKEAGLASGYPDEQYIDKGARVITDRRELIRAADAVFLVRGPAPGQAEGGFNFDLLRKGQLLVGFLNPLVAEEAVRQLASLGVTALALELIPRISRAQSMDALSSMTSLAGYKAVVLAAAELPKIFPLMMTAAGSLAPARAFVIGAGVAGLQACATAKRMGALVKAYDVRPEVREQVQSVGAAFVEFDLPVGDTQDGNGYAKVQDEAFYARQREEMTRVVAESDVVIATAGVPGKQAPILITEDMVRAMKPRSVIIDVVAEMGGNCALTQPGRTIVAHGVTVMGPLNLPSTLAYHASQLLARNITTLFDHLTDDEGRLKLDLTDQITAETLVCHQGELVSPRVRAAAGLGTGRAPRAN